MGFKSKVIAGDSTNTISVIENSEYIEAIINSITIVNIGTVVKEVRFFIDNTTVDIIKIQAESSYKLPDKINIGAGSTFGVFGETTTVTTVSYIQQPVDTATALDLITTAVDNKANIDTVSNNISDVNTVADNIDDVQQAYNNALIAQSAINLKGTWDSGYNSGNGYSKGDSVVYIDGLAYVSLVDSNTAEPSLRVSTDNWLFVLGGLKGGSVTDCGGASNVDGAPYDCGSASNT